MAMRGFFAREIIAPEGSLAHAYLLEDQGLIAAISRDPVPGVPVTAFPAGIIAPGLIDVHTHGALGYEAGYGCREDLRRWSEYQFARGVTGFLPTTASIPYENVRLTLEMLREIMAEPGTNILGLQMEGPFFAGGAKIGAQNPAYIRQDFASAYRDLLDHYRDTIRYLALDPILAAADEIARFCAERDIRVSAAHSEIAYADFLSKKPSGFSAITHTFNGMSGLDHRRPGLAYAACLDPDLFAEIICDGHHVCYPMIDLFLKLKGPRRAILVTDSTAATGMPSGVYTMGELAVTVTDDGRVTKAGGVLAGSTLTMDQAVRNLVNNLGVPLAEAIYMASATPAAMLGLDGERGSLTSGRRADFVVLDAELNVVATYLRGRQVFGSPPSPPSPLP